MSSHLSFFPSARCCSCDFATTNMNSLKSHMRRHPQEHQAMQLLEQYRWDAAASRVDRNQISILINVLSPNHKSKYRNVNFGQIKQVNTGQASETLTGFPLHHTVFTSPFPAEVVTVTWQPWQENYCTGLFPCQSLTPTQSAVRLCFQHWFFSPFLWVDGKRVFETYDI